jgi:3'(2'), 5'-bisphosphate nucleotidase
MPTATALLVDAIRTLAIQAGEAILEVYDADDPGVREKADRSPVTEADLRAEALILRGLAEIAPGVPVVAEESVAAGRAPSEPGARFWLVDPLDGTKEFLSRNGEFTVNIALVEDGTPTLGVVHVPAVGLTYVGAPGIAEMTDDGVPPRPLGVVAAPADGLRALVSRSHLDPDTEQWLAGVDVASFVQAGSSLKFCRIAEGAADVYPRFGRTMEWDTAAGHAVLLAAGGSVRTPSGAPLTYGKSGFENPPFIAYGGSRPGGRQS